MSTDTDPATLLSGATAARWVGQRIPRLEDQRMITGHGRYIDDLQKAGMVHAAFVRSTVARGRITGLDVSEARRAPGVVAVLTAAEINGRAREVPRAPVDRTPRRVLADGDVRFVGEPIVIVVAESRYLAEDAAELVSVDIEPEDPVVDAAAALAEGSPPCTRSCRTTCPGCCRPRTLPELDGLLDRAPHVFHETFTQHRYVCVPMETRGVIAEWDQSGQAARGGHRRPGRARSAAALLPDAGHPRGRRSGWSWAMWADRSARRRFPPGRTRPS